MLAEKGEGDMELQGAKPVRFMLIEDSEGDAYIFRRTLVEAKIANEVTVFCNGKDALTFLMDPANSESLPGMIFLDINMPRLSGFDVLKRLKHEERLRNIPVVILTISQEEEDVLKSYDLGALSFITKSIRPENLMDVVVGTPGIKFLVIQ